MQSKPIKTTPELVELLKMAKDHVMTPREIWLQRLSFVYGNLPEENTLTREDVERHMNDEYGPCPPKSEE